MRFADVKVLDCSWGIGAKVANDSMRSAANTLAEYASKGGQADIDGYATWVMLSLRCTVLCSKPCAPAPTWFSSYVTLAAGLGILHRTLPMVIC